MSWISGICIGLNAVNGTLLRSPKYSGTSVTHGGSVWTLEMARWYQRSTSPSVLPWVINWIIHLGWYCAFSEIDHCIITQALLSCAVYTHFGFMSSYICLNPHCKGRCRRFVTEKLFGMHSQKSDSCWHFFRSRMSAGGHLTAAFDHRLIGSVPLRSLVEDTNAFYLSSQERAVPLRFEFVHDDFLTSRSKEHPFNDANVPVSPHAPYQPLWCVLCIIKYNWRHNKSDILPTIAFKCAVWQQLGCWSCV